MTFLDRIDSLLKRNDLTRKWLSYESGVPYNTISGWYSKNRDPKLAEAEKIARALRVSIDYLQTGEGLQTFEDQNLKDICETLMELSHDELVFAKGWLAAMQLSKMHPKGKTVAGRIVADPEREENAG